MRRHFTRSDTHRSLKILTRTIVALSIVFALVWARTLLIPISLAVLFTCLLNPLVRYFRVRGVGHLGSVAIAVIIAGGSFLLTAWLVTREFSSVVANFPEYSHNIREKVRSLKRFGSGTLLHRYDEMIREVANEIQPPPPIDRAAPVQSWWSSILPQTSTQTVEGSQLSSIPWITITGYLGSAADVAGMLAFTFVLTIFLLSGQIEMRDRLALLAGRSNLALTSYALSEASEKISRYLGTVAVLNAGLGLVMMAGLYLLNVPFAFLAGFLAGALRFIPYIGPFFGGAFPVVLSIACSDGWTTPLFVLAMVLVMELVCNNVIEPLLFGHSTGVSPIALIVSAAFWLLVWGPIGLIMSAPIAVCLVVLGQYVHQLRFLTLVLGNSSPLEPDLQLYQRMVQCNRPEAAEIVKQFSEQSDSTKIYDRLLIPVLINARRDDLKGLLREDTFDEIVDHVVELSQDIAKSRATDPMDNLVIHGCVLTVLGCAAMDRADHAVLQMLGFVMFPSRWQLRPTSMESLTGEMRAIVLDNPPDVICIASLPPRGVSHAVYLCKRLREVTPDIPIIVGRFGSKSVRSLDHERLIQAGATSVVTSLQAVTRQLNSMHPILVSKSGAFAISDDISAAVAATD